MSKKLIGIDLGGSNVRIAKVDENGVIVQDVIADSHGKEGQEIQLHNKDHYSAGRTPEVYSRQDQGRGYRLC